MRLGAHRVELGFWDDEPAFALAALGLSGLGTLLLGLPWPLGAGVLLVWAVLAAGARRVLVVTPEGAWLEQRVLGLRWKRQPLGRRPVVESGLVWDWRELAVVPSEKHLCPPLHDGERAVLREWSWASVAEDARDVEAARLAALANGEIARLHGI